jgi:protein-disulfide isomerase
MNKTRWIIFIGLCIAILGVLIFVNKGDDAYKGDVSKPITDAAGADHVFGSNDNKVVLIEYGDFQCPACLNIFPTVKELKTAYKDQLTFVFRNLPLTNVHPNALAAATAAEAAGQQSKFFEMFDALYENQADWRDKSVSDRGAAFEQLAQSIGLDMNRYKQDLSSKLVSEKINRDRATARTINATSTPTFLLNGQKLPEDVSVNGDRLKEAVKQALEAAGYTNLPTLGQQ